MMELHFTRTNGPADEAIEKLMEMAGGIDQPEIIREMILAALKTGQEKPQRGDLKMMNSTLKEMRFTAKVFGTYAGVRKVTAFGSARTGETEPIYGIAREFGMRLAREGYMVITGGGPGIMQAVSEGAGAEKSFGVNIRLPFEQKYSSILEGNPRNIMYKYFFNRKVAFLKEADAVALFPGGFGTLDEAMETLTLLQTGKRDPIPLILIDEPEGTYWRRIIDFFGNVLLSTGYISETDFDLFELVDSVDEAVSRINRFYHRYHSIRYVGTKTVIRLTSEIDRGRVKRLKRAYEDILIPGGDICASCPLDDEADQPHLSDLPRIVIDFRRRDFGRLRRLIDDINAD